MPWRREREYPLSTGRRERANQLRRRTTEPERRLWWHLRNRLPQDATHWRRQVALASYVVDFCCLEHRLIVEVDGEQHGFEANLVRDAERTRRLAEQGFCVLRFSNRDVMTAIDIVLDTILAACGPTSPTAGPSPEGGRDDGVPTAMRP